jgi:hypothetical protein
MIPHCLPRAALAGLVLASGFAVAPVHAGTAEVALLQSYAGEWRGRGVLTGAESETVVCRLDISPGNDDKMNYSGRCALAGTTLSVKGTIAYDDGNRRFLAIMTTNATFSSGTAVGRRQGNGIVFNLREKDTDEAGNEMTITASIGLQPSRIGVEFQVVFNETGDVIKATVPFTK